MITWLKHKAKNCLALREDLVFEVITRLVIITVFVISDYAVPFKRKIQPEEVWLYSFPRSDDFIPFKSLQVFILAFSLTIISAIYQRNRKIEDAVSAVLGLTLAMYLSATVTNFIKLVVGRPRPDFMDRCFLHPPEDTQILAQAACDRDEETVNQGYKSFPSGHSTMALSGLSYLSLYIVRSLRVFSQHHSRFTGLKLCFSLAPLVVGVLVAASRTADYHHHWQDVVVGSLIGVLFAFMCFRQSFQGPLHKSKRLSLPDTPTPKSPPAHTDVQIF